MAQRLLDAAFWDDEDIARLSLPARLLFICMITDSSLSDDYGCLPASSRTLRKHAFGYDDDISITQVGQWRDEILQTCRNVVRYENNGQEYLYLAKFAVWQKLRYQRASNIPKPADEDSHISENFGKFPKHCANFPLDRVELDSVGEDSAAEISRDGIAPPAAVASAEPDAIPFEEQPEPVTEPAMPKAKEPLPPAIQAFANVTGHKPPKVLYDKVRVTLGDQPDETRMRICLEEWVSRGYRATNRNWLFDWYVKGIPGILEAMPTRASPGPPAQAKPPPRFVDWMKGDAHGNGSNGDGNTTA